jgi:hypothetical protein
MQVKRPGDEEIVQFVRQELADIAKELSPGSGFPFVPTS